MKLPTRSIEILNKCEPKLTGLPTEKASQSPICLEGQTWPLSPAKRKAPAGHDSDSVSLIPLEVSFTNDKTTDSLLSSLLSSLR